MSWYGSHPIDNGGHDPSYVPCEWSTGTDEQIIEALRMHYFGVCNLHDYWSVGDERVIHLSAMTNSYVGETHVEQDVVFVLSEVGGKLLEDGVTECCFQVDQKNCLKETGYISTKKGQIVQWSSCSRNFWINQVYIESIPSTIRPIFKYFTAKTASANSQSSGSFDSGGYFMLRSEMEVFGTNTKAYSESPDTQVEWYKTTANRIKSCNGTNSDWWLRSPTHGMVSTNQYGGFCYVQSSGAINSTYINANKGIALFGVI